LQCEALAAKRLANAPPTEARTAFAIWTFEHVRTISFSTIWDSLVVARIVGPLEGNWRHGQGRAAVFGGRSRHCQVRAKILGRADLGSCLRSPIRRASIGHGAESETTHGAGSHGKSWGEVAVSALPRNPQTERSARFGYASETMTARGFGRIAASDIALSPSSQIHSQLSLLMPDREVA
jgi:hypothetical protein